jgi:multiple sugar transport system substrate-binding protein
MFTTPAKSRPKARPVNRPGLVTGVVGALAVTLLFGTATAATKPAATKTTVAKKKTSKPTTTKAGKTVGTPTTSPVAAGFNWRQFQGEKIRVVLNQHPWQQAIEPMIADFEKQTGIKVEVEKLPEEQFRQRTQVELTAGSKDLDVFMTSILNEGAKFSKNGWYQDLRPFVENPKLTSPDYNFADFGAGLVRSHTFNKKLIALPIQLETQMLYYRKDILAKAGLKAPATLDELEAAAFKIDDPKGTRAFISRGKGRAAVTQISSYLYNYGGSWTKEGTNTAAFNSREGVKAFSYYTKMLRDYAPKGTANMSWEEALPLFSKGQVAMYTDASTFLPRILENGTPEVVNNLGFAPMPSGPGGDDQTFFGWGIGMSSFSRKQGPSWLFIQWATSPTIVERLTIEGKVAGGRSSVKFGNAFPAEWVKAFTASLPTARPQLPSVIPVSEVRDVIGAAIVKGIEGGDMKTALDQAAKDFDVIVENAS